MKRFWSWALLFAFALLLCGCKVKQTALPSVVTQVQILYTKNQEQRAVRYTDEETVSAVLDGLRLLRSMGTAPVDPERLAGDRFVIRVYLSSGDLHVYRYAGGGYLSKDSGPWQVVSPEQSEQMQVLLQSLL